LSIPFWLNESTFQLHITFYVDFMESEEGEKKSNPIQEAAKFSSSSL
jgi:hypothetical protein